MHILRKYVDPEQNEVANHRGGSQLRIVSDEVFSYYIFQAFSNP